MVEVNPYEDLVDSDVETDKSQIKANLNFASDSNPDSKAEALRIANEFQVPVEFAEQNIDDFKKKSTQFSDNQYDEIINNFPATTDFLKDATSASIAQDSIDELKNIESKTDSSFLGDMKDSLVYGVINGVAKGTVDFAKMNRDASKSDWNELTKGMDQRLVARNPFDVYQDGQLENASTYLSDKSKKYLSDDAQKSIIDSAIKGDFSGATKAAVLQITQSVPQLALVAMNARLGLGSMFVSETGSKYTENLAAGIPQDTARTNAIITGAISTGIESIGGVGAGGLKSIIKNSVEKLGEQTTKKILKSAGMQILKTAGEEGLEESATTLSQRLVDYGMDVNPNLDGLLVGMGDAFIVGAGSGGVIGAIQSPLAIANQYNKINKSQLNSETYEQLGDVAKDSKLRKRSPEKFREFVEKSTKGTPFENVFVKAESVNEYFQKNNLNTEEELARMGLLEAYEKAMETHGELTVPASEWLSKTVDTDLYKALKDDVKYSPEDVSVNESKREAKETKAEVQKQIEAAKKSEAEGKEIVDDVYNQLVEAGVAKSEAKQQAPIYRAFNVLAERAGISPKELYSRYGLKIIGQQQYQPEHGFEIAAQSTVSLQKNDNGMYEYDPEILSNLRKSISDGELIKSQAVVNEQGDTVGSLGGASTYPDFFKDKGYTKKLALGVIDKFNSGKPLTEKQIDILNDLYEGVADKINRQEYFQGDDAQLKRAKEMGFDTDRVYYHGGPVGIESFRTNEKGVNKYLEGVYMAYQENDASRYAEQIDPKLNKSSVYKFFLPKNMLDLDNFQSVDSALRTIGLEIPNLKNSQKYKFNPEMTNLMKMRIAVEKSGVKTKDVDKVLREKLSEAGFKGMKTDNDQIAVVFSPNDVRQTSAQFKKKGDNSLFQKASDFITGNKSNELFQASKNSIKLGLKFAAIKNDNKLTIRPTDSMVASAELVNSPAGVIAVVDNIKLDDKYKGVSEDMLKSLELAASRNGAKAISVSARRIGAKVVDKAFIDFYEKAGFVQTNVAGDVMFTKKLIQAESYNQDVKGSFNPDTNTIKLFASKDQSTFLHESAHLFLNVLTDLAATNPTESIVKDVEMVYQWLGVNDLTEIKPEHHEKWARGFEKYLMTGESPSPELRKAFNTFKIWLTRIYKNVSGLSRAAGFDVQITPQIKGVMDRLLVSEEEISQAEAEMQIEPLFKDLAGLNEKDQAKYKDMLEDSRSYAEAKLNKKLIDELNRKQRAEYKSRFKEQYDAIIDQLKDKPIYKAIEAMKTEEGKIDPQSVEQALGKEMAELIPNKLKSKTSGIDYNIIAEMFGFEPTAFITELVETPSIEQAAKSQAEELMKQEFPELYKDPEIKDAAKEAIHNEKRSELLKFELEYLEKEYASTFKDAIRKTVRRSPLSSDVKAQAEKHILGTKIKDVKPYLYLRAERQFAKEAGIALAKGDIKTAFEAKRREYYNYEIYRSAVEAQHNVEKSVKNFKKMFKKTEDLAKGRDIDLVNAAREVLASFGIVYGKNVNPETYLEQMKEYDKQQYESLTNIISDATKGAAPYEQVSYNDFIEMKDAVDALWSLSKENKNIEINGKSVEIAQAVTDLNSQILVHTDGKVPSKVKHDLSDIEKFKVRLLGARASLTRTESWVELMDLGKHDGFFRTYIFNPVSESITKYRLKKKDVVNEYKKIVDEYKDIFDDKPIIAKNLDNFVFKQKSNLIMAILHTGNESNKSKLLRGRGWGDVRDDGTVDSTQFDSFIDSLQRDGTLTKRDYEFAQKIWDLMESLKPDAQKAHKKMYGYYFNEITSKEFQTPFGTFRGGYIPAKVDVYTNEDAAIREERNDLEKNNNSFQFPTTGRGFTKSRVDSYAAPLSLEVNLLASHIDGVMRFSYVEPHLKQVSRLVMNKDFRTQLAILDPQIAGEMIVPWLQRSAQQKVVLPSTTGIGKALDGAAAYLRTSVAMQFMVGNVTNAAQQLTGIIVAASKVQPKHLSHAMYSYVTDRKNVLKSIYEKSEWMSANQDSNIYEVQGAINEIVVNPGTFENVRNFAKSHTYFLQSFTQNIVNTIVWQGAYNQAVENKLSEKESIRAADSAVRLTQGTTNAEDISRYETGTATYRLFTQFAGYFNMLANLNASEIGKISKTIGLKKGSSKLFYLYVTALMVPAVMSQAIVLAARGKGLDEEDDGYLDDIMSLFFGSQAQTITAAVPFVGPMLNSAANRFNKKTYDDKLGFSPVLSVLESVLGTPAAVYKGLEKGEIKKQAVKDSLMLLGVITQLPIGPVGKPVGYSMDVSSGKAQPKGAVDFTRGLVTGQPGKK